MSSQASAPRRTDASSGIGMPTSLADFRPMTTQPRMLVSPTGSPGLVPPGQSVAGPRPDEEGDRPRGRVAEPGVARQGIALAQGQRGHRVAVHPDDHAVAAEVAVGLLLRDEEV